MNGLNKEPRLRFTDEERADPALEKPIRKADKAAAKADKAQAKIPKKQVRQKTVDPETGKVTTKLVLEDKKKPPSKLSHAVRDTPANAALGKVHKEIRETEQDNVGVESAHKSEEAAETGARLVREGYRSHKLKPYRKAAQAEQKLEKANVNALYQKSLRENPQLASNPISRWQQKQAIKKEYAAAKRAGQAAGNTASAAQKTGKAAKTVKEKAQEAGAFVMRHKKGFLIAGAIFLLVCMLLNTMSSCSMMAQSIGSVVSGTTYPSDDPELVAVEADYAAKEAALQAEIDNIESSHPGYDEYRYDLDMIGHDPHELAAYLSAVLQGYTRQSAQAELERVFDAQYQLTLTEEVEVRYRTETRTDSEGNSYTVQVPYNYYILNVKLTSKPISSVASELLTPEQLEMYQVYRQTLGNKPLIFGGGSSDTSDSESLAGVEFVNGTRPGNQTVVDIAKSQVGNVGGQPYWSWYGFNSRVEWCACFVSWCYGQMGLSEPRFAACQSQGIPWFQSHGQWGGRDYANIAPGDAIFFDWDLDGSADHVGLVVGTDGSRVYTVEGNSGDACKIKSYSLSYECIKGYGLMNWYPHSAAYAKEHGELEQYRASNNANLQCKEAIEAAVREHFDGMYLSHDAAKGVIETYGMDRVMLVLASTVQLQDWDGRYSPRNKEWAKTIPNYNSDTVRCGYALNSHPAVLNGFIDLVREEHLRRQPLTAEDIQAEAERILRELRAPDMPNSPHGTHYMARISPEFLNRAGSKDHDRLMNLLPFRSLSFTGMKGLPGTYATILANEDRSKELRQPRPSVREHLKQEPKQAAPKAPGQKKREPER